MAEPETQSAQDAGELDEALLRAISHPLRHRLLGMLDGRIASPNMLARELDLPLGRVSYHIRLLNDLGAIELVRTEPRRGALEHFYRAVTTVWFSEGDWTKLPRSARRGILGQNLQQIFGNVTAAADDGGFDHAGERRPARAAGARRGGHERALRAAARRGRSRPRDQRPRRRARRTPRSPPKFPCCFSSAARKLGDMAGLRRALVAIAAALALADASIVALALPPILVEMDTTITGVAAVVGVYALVLALGILPAARLDARRAGFWGLRAVRGRLAGLRAGGSLGVLLVFRALQAAGGAAALLAAFQVLDAGESRTGRRLWLGAALVGTAAGPAIGGVLTEVFDWRAIFFVQAPLAAAAALACLRPRERARRSPAPRPRRARTVASRPGG